MFEEAKSRVEQKTVNYIKLKGSNNSFPFNLRYQNRR